MLNAHSALLEIGWLAAHLSQDIQMASLCSLMDLDNSMHDGYIPAIYIEHHDLPGACWLGSHIKEKDVAPSKPRLHAAAENYNNLKWQGSMRHTSARASLWQEAGGALLLLWGC